MLHCNEVRRAIPIPLDRRRLLLAASGAVVAPAGAALAQSSPVDLALVLAADCSGSVRAEHYRLQQQGYADAFRQREVIRAIASGLHGAIAVTYFQWSGFTLQNHALPWRILRGPAETMDFAAEIETVGREIYSGGTSPAGAIEFGRRLLDGAAVQPRRRVIDVSGDGRSNNGPPPPPSRDAAVAQGITINGLPILHMEPDIDAYYEENVIGGPGAFIMPARDFAAFGEAVRRKLILEIAGHGGVPMPG